MRRAIFPGSFDPITNGHYDIVQRGVKLFDEVIVAIGVNADKKYMFSLEERQSFIEKSFKDEPKVKVVTYQGLTIDFCKDIDAQFILRGLRNPADFDFISSSIVRDVIRNNGDYTQLVPESVVVKNI